MPSSSSGAALPPRPRLALLPVCLFIAASQAPCGAGAPGPEATPPGADDPCAGLVEDRSARPLAALEKPALGQSVVDPAFGGRLRRITVVPPSEGENAIVKPMYSTVQAWNADESRLILWHRGQGHELYDGTTYAFLRRLPLVSPTDLEQVLWDPVDPDVLYYPSSYNAVPQLMRYRVSADASEVVRRFEFCPVDWGKLLSLGNDPGYLSWGPESKVLGLQCGDEKFLYDVASDAVLARTVLGTPNAPQVAPSGRLAYLDGRVLDRSLRPVRTLDLGNPAEHASLGRSAETGHDLYCAVAFDPPRGGATEAHVGTLVVHDLETGARRVIIGPGTDFRYPPGGTHLSAVAHRRPGWVAVSVVGDPRSGELLDGELLLAHVDSGRFCRVAHHRSSGGDGRWGYWAEPHVVVSPTATRLLFASDWGGGPSVDTYVVELPGFSIQPRRR